jgi:magnesium-protoporphyrin O-methyltransferase
MTIDMLGSRSQVQRPFSTAPRTPRQVTTQIVCSTQPESKNLRRLAKAAPLPAALLLAGPAAAANETLASLADGSSISLAVGGGAAIAALSAALIVTDPQNRRSAQMAETGGDELEAVKKYFNTAGFDRWRKIYGETDDVNKVQLDIRQGHAQTVEKVLRWLDEEGGVVGTTICDAGCGTGSLAIPLALRGATLSASDISEAMTSEAQRRYEAAIAAGAAAPATAPRFEPMDLETCSGKYHTVTCLDVMIHYPQDKVNGMIEHLASLAEERLILSFAPKTLAYSILKRIGELFPGPSKATRAYLHSEEDVEAALAKAGFKVTKREMTATSFYFSRLLEAKRVA